LGEGAAVQGEEGIEVFVQLRADEARALRGLGPAAPEAEALRTALADAGVELEPVDPDTDDPTLATHYWLHADDLDSAAEIVARLRETGAVESAYPKPRASLP
jgi:hypothetical protein